MAVRRLHPEQPDGFAFSRANLAWAKKEIGKYPKGRQASAVIPLLWKAQEQHDNWLPEPAIRAVADMLEMPYIRVLEVATFYTMFQLAPVGKKAHIQVCGTTPCVLRGAEDIRAVCQRRIAANPHQLSDDGDFSWEEVECLGACVNAPMVQVFADTYEDLNVDSFEQLLDDFAAGRSPDPGPQIKRQYSAPYGGTTTLKDLEKSTPRKSKPKAASKAAGDPPATQAARPPKDDGSPRKPRPAAEVSGKKPKMLKAARKSGADDLKQIKGVGPKLEDTLNALGVYHFDQIAAWTPKEVVWVDDNLNFKGRIDRDGWISQAEDLAKASTSNSAKTKA